MLKLVNRRLILPLIYGLKGYKLIRHNPFRMILCYHGVAKRPDFRLNNRHMNLVQFEKDLAFFKRNYQILSVKELFRCYRENIPIGKTEIALTFDDGFLNNFIYVKPLLEKFEIPATFYILGKSIENPDFVNWADLIDLVLFHTTSETVNFNGVEFNRNSGWRNQSGEPLFNVIKLMAEERDPALLEFYNRYNGVHALKSVSEELWKPMGVEQIIACSQSNFISIGSHTHNHYNLANVSSDLARLELSESKKIIENLIQNEVTEIAFPDGSYNATVKDLAETAGYEYQLAVDYKEQGDNADQRILNRFSISNSTTHEANVIRMHLQS